MMDDRLKNLETEINAMKAAKAPAQKNTMSGGSVAAKAGVDVFVGTGVGGVLGYAFDSYFEMLPILTIIFLLLGLAGGILNAYRTVSGIGYQLGYPNAKDKLRDDTNK